METILLIEPDPGKLIALALILRSFGYTVLEATGRGEAWSAYREHHGLVHLLIMKTARDSDREFIARLRLVCPRISALLVTDSASTLAGGHPSCEWTWLQEPFPPNVLADTIRGLLDRPKSIASSFLS